MTLPLSISPEVRSAKADGTPIVALESTIVTHGLPYPENLQTALAVESDIRTAGGVPATVAVLNGQMHVGLSVAEISSLAERGGVLKLSRADLAAALVQSSSGSTTVAATMIVAHLAGIEIFATGGIGGVHRGAETSFDVSADLQEFANTPVTVVAAGAKAILDLPKTLEMLETLGVPVIGYRTDAFPAFWSRSSGLVVPIRMDRPDEIAMAHIMRRKLGLAGGQLVANPVPHDAEIDRAEITDKIEQSLRDAANQGIVGKSVTPFLLERILRLTDGRSLATNIALIRNNAQLATEIAVEIKRQRGAAAPSAGVGG